MKKIVNILIVLCLALIYACQDSWDAHYAGEQGEMSSELLGDFLAAQEKYSRFTGLLKETGVLETLDADQILTVWAVGNDNMPSVEELDKYNAEEKKQIARNAINYMPIYYPKFMAGKKIQTLAGKNVYMGTNANGYTLDGLLVVSPNHVCGNGVVHELAGLMFPRKNLYEYLEMLPDEYSMIRDSLLSRNDTLFDMEHSFPVGVDETGNTLYDSIFVIRNSFIGDIRNEEVRNTLMLCDNDVITAAFEEMRNYLLADTLSDELRKDMSDWWQRALIYPEQIDDYNKDRSVYSIYKKHWRTDIQEVDLSGRIPVSNGLIYPVWKFVFPKSSLLKDVEYTIPDIWQRLPAGDREKYFTYGGKGYTTTSAEIIYTDAQLNNNLHAKGISNTWWRANSSKNTQKDTVYAEFTLLERDLKNKIAPIQFYPGTYDVYVWLRSYAAVPVTISVVSDAVEGAVSDKNGRYVSILREQAKQDLFSKTGVVDSYYDGKVGTIKLTKPTDNLRLNLLIWDSGTNKNINIRGIKLVANRDEMY